MPSDTEALASAQAIKASQKKQCLYAILTLVFGIAISLVFPLALMAVVIGLIIVYRINSSECRPHENVLQQFAETRNWYYEPRTELRTVKWQKRRVRFYCTAPLLSVNSIADCLISNDFAPRTPPPTGEVPRKRPYSSNEYTHLETTRIAPPQDKHQLPADLLHISPAAPPVGAAARDEQQTPAIPPHIPPAGWTTTSVIYAVPPTSSPALADETNRRTSAPKEPPAAKTAKPPRRRKAHTSSEATTQSIPDPSPTPEGGRKPKTNYAVVRSAKLRKAAIQIHGRNCSACGFNFDETFGEILSQGYIEIHHLNSIAAGVRNTDPATDLAPLCGNCHAMADRLTRHHAYPPRSIGALRKLLFPASSLPDVEMHSAAEVPKSPVKTKIGKIRENKSRKGS